MRKHNEAPPLCLPAAQSCQASGVLFRRPWPGLPRLARVAQGVFDAPLGYMVVPVDALGVDLEQDGDAVPGPLGDLGGRDAPVKPGRDTRVPEVVDALGQRGRVFTRGHGAAEAFNAYQLLADLARSVGLDSKYEVVPPPGLVDLNRPNLIVLTNPRLLPFLSQVMGADPHLGYAEDDGGWYLVDKTAGVEYRSPMDRGESSDYAYVGRLPRPDGKGTFLYLAGTHAPGTLAAAHFVVDNIVDLHRDLKNRRFSMVIVCDYDPKDRKKILSTKPLTPIYRPESS
jgi:hypothetical protein